MKTKEIAEYFLNQGFKIGDHNGFTKFYGKKFRDLDVEIILKYYNDKDIINIQLLNKRDNIISSYNFFAFDFNTDYITDYLNGIYKANIEYLKQVSATK